MKNDCAYTRKSLHKYLRGHLFKYEQIRIARHLNACPVCRSEFQSLKRVADTKQLLKDITPPEGVAQRMKAGVSRLARLKLLLYRPLWVMGIVGIGVLIYVNVIAPQRHDVEIENIEKSLPPAPLASSPAVTPAANAPAQTVPLNQSASQQPGSGPASASAAEPLVITITPASETAVRSINQIMKGRGLGKFSETVREIQGSLTSKELDTLLNRVEQGGSVAYSRKRFESFPAAQPVPFLIKMKNLPRGEHPGQAKAARPSESLPQPVSAPSTSAL